MQNHSYAPTPWIKVGLAILPGLLAIGVSGIVSTQTRGLIPIAGLALCVLASVIGSIQERQVPTWSFTTWGVLFGLLGGPFWLLLGLLGLLAAIIGLVVTSYRKRSVRIPRQVWIILAGVVGLAFVPPFNDHDSYSYWLNLWRNLAATGLMLIVSAPGLLFAKRRGVLVGLFVVAVGFPLWEEILDLTYGLWRTPWGIVMVVTLAFLLLVVSPIWVLRSRSRHGQVWGLLLPAFIALTCVTVINATVRTDPTILERIVNFRAVYPGDRFVYGISGGSLGPEALMPLLIRDGLAAARLFAGLVLAVVLYDWIEGQGTARSDVQSAREASSKKSMPETASNAV